MSNLSDKTVLDTIQAGVTTLLATTGTTLQEAIEGVAADIAFLQDDKIGTPVGATISIDLQNAAKATAGQKYVRPSLANSVSVTGAAGVWGEGAYVEIIPANNLAVKYAVYAVVVETLAGVHQLTLASGLAAAEVPFGTIVIAATGKYYFFGPALAANTRVSAKTASKAGGAQAVSIYIEAYTGLQ